jgi:hypothetical protein
VSRFSDNNKWLPLAQTSRKELIQNKLSREIVEKHYLKNVEWDDVKQDAIIFEWRKDPRTALFCVEMLELRKLAQDEEGYCLSACQHSQKETDLIVYTEHIYKLYETNPKCPLEEADQLAIFKGIIEGVDMLSQKFGEFAVTKDMVGYNAAKRGKAWCNENFCVNQLQSKRPARTPEERTRWERDVVEALLAICKLCSIDKNLKNNKFYNVMELIMRNRLYKFANFRDFGPFQTIDLSQGHKDIRTTRDYRQSQEQGSSGHNSNGLASTDDRLKRVKIFSKTFEFPVIKIYEPDRNMTVLEPQHQVASHPTNITLGGPKPQGSKATGNTPAQLRSNQRQAHQNNHLSPQVQ